jgi:hypothetical protein
VIRRSKARKKQRKSQRNKKSKKRRVFSDLFLVVKKRIKKYDHL